METENKKFTMYAPIMKMERSDEYICVLSDTSIDRDGEIVSKQFMEMAAGDNYMPALIDHDNKALNLVAEWVDKRVIEVEPDRYAFTAKPKFYLSNPNARIIKDMMDKDGAKFGLSITAIPYTHDFIDNAGTKTKRWLTGEIVSTDFVGIPAQKYATAMRIAKSLEIEKGKGPYADAQLYECNDCSFSTISSKLAEEHHDKTGHDIRWNEGRKPGKSLELDKDWKCPECGKSNFDNEDKCSKCGCKPNKSCGCGHKKKELENTEINKGLKCPHCGSTDTDSNIHPGYIDCNSCGKATKKSFKEEENMSEETIKELKDLMTEINKNVLSLKKSEEPAPVPDPVPEPAPAPVEEKKIEPEKAIEKREETLKELDKSLPINEPESKPEIKANAEGFIKANRRRN